MATFYLDLEGGNDANDGTTFANRWLTFTSGATAARIAPGDTIRVMASPDATLVGNAAWTNASKTVTLAAAVNSLITDCETNWTASANVTASLNTTTEKSGSNCQSLAIASGFTTGKVAYFATGTLDLSAYQQITLWIRASIAIPASTLSIKLCSDTTGDTAVDTFVVPANPAANTWAAVTIDKGAALGSAIASIALYADADPGTMTVLLDNINAAKAASSADSLTLNSLIGKVHNLSWVASTTYAANDKRRPTQPNRNGFQYKVTAGGGGSSGSSEPTWPQRIGATVTDGALTWTCEELEDTWYPIQSISGTTVMIDNSPNSTANVTATPGRGYYGATEAVVATYKREPIQQAMLTNSTSWNNGITDSGTVNSLITFSGGWNRTDMSTQTGETWVDGRNATGLGYAANSIGTKYWELVNLSAVRFGNPFTGWENTGGLMKLTNCSGVGCGAGPNSRATPLRWKISGGAQCNHGGAVFDLIDPDYDIKRLRVENNLGSAAYHQSSATARRNVQRSEMCYIRNNNGYGVLMANSIRKNDFHDCVFGGNSTGAVSDVTGMTRLFNCDVPDSAEFAAVTAQQDGFVASIRNDQTADTHTLTFYGGTVVSDTSQRHTASGIAWKFSPTNTARGEHFPMVLPIGKIVIASGASKTVSIWTRRSTTDIKGKLVCRGGQGIGAEQSVAAEPSIDTWTQSSTMVLTALYDCVVELEFHVWDGVGTAANYWIDDLTVT